MKKIIMLLLSFFIFVGSVFPSPIKMNLAGYGPGYFLTEREVEKVIEVFYINRQMIEALKNLYFFMLNVSNQIAEVGAPSEQRINEIEKDFEAFINQYLEETTQEEKKE
jgi:hypothetical protein